MSKLSVNINKVATLRNSRGGDIPNVLTCAEDLLRFGAQGITVHPRPDGRHIKTHDVYDLARLLKKWNRTRRPYAEFNIEGYPSPAYMRMIDDVKPDQATLVPDPPEALTSNAGWEVHRHEKTLARVLGRLRRTGVRSSIFIDVFACSAKDLAALKRLRPDRVELYTERFAKDFSTKNRTRTTRRYASAAREIRALGIEINAGHDLSLQNVRYLLRQVPEIVECSIGHALIAEALYLGFKKTIRSYRHEMRPNPRTLRHA